MVGVFWIWAVWGRGGVVLLRRSPVMVLFGGGGAYLGVIFRLVVVAREGGFRRVLVSSSYSVGLIACSQYMRSS